MAHTVRRHESHRLQARYAMALLKRVVQGQVDAAAGRMIPHEQVMAEVRALIDAEIAKKSVI